MRPPVSVVSAVIITKLADFGAKVAMSLGMKFNDGPFHRYCESRRKRYAEEDLRKSKK